MTACYKIPQVSWLPRDDGSVLSAKFAPKCVTQHAHVRGAHARAVLEYLATVKADAITPPPKHVPKTATTPEFDQAQDAADMHSGVEGIGEWWKDDGVMGAATGVQEAGKPSDEGPPKERVLTAREQELLRQAVTVIFQESWPTTTVALIALLVYQSV